MILKSGYTELSMQQWQVTQQLPHLVNLSLPCQEDEHVSGRLVQVDVHGSVHSCSQVVLQVVLLAVHYLHLKGAPRHTEHGAVVKVGAELLPLQCR